MLFYIIQQIYLVIHLLSCLNVFFFFVIKQHQIKCGRWKEKKTMAKETHGKI